jgi:hypothetical protein
MLLGHVDDFVTVPAWERKRNDRRSLSTCAPALSQQGRGASSAPPGAIALLSPSSAGQAIVSKFVV